MTSPLRVALGADWDRLPPVLQAHHRDDDSVEHGLLDIEMPPAMRPVWWCLSQLGVLVGRPQRQAPTKVVRRLHAGRQHWLRTMEVDGRLRRFDSVWEVAGPGRLREQVNPLLGLEMAVWVDGGRLRCRGLHYRLGWRRWVLRLPCWLGPGEAWIEETALDAQRYAMDFRLRHPLFGEVFRYAGVFRPGAG
jgi:hypothetical protein